VFTIRDTLLDRLRVVLEQMSDGGMREKVEVKCLYWRGFLELTKD